ncbi:MAG: hypothetical protein EAZ92_16725 [Candidatus Kapaibacterium sp.]|nr:MAG: hypothetical protein EAZ92_16725 [Candidatus Kapabacteria bacterium]
MFGSRGAQGLANIGKVSDFPNDLRGASERKLHKKAFLCASHHDQEDNTGTLNAFARTNISKQVFMLLLSQKAILLH